MGARDCYSDRSLQFRNEDMCSDFRSAGPCNTRPAPQCRHEPGRDKSSLSVKRPHRAYKHVRWVACVSGQKIAGNRSISFSHPQHSITFTQRKYFTWASGSPHNHTGYDRMSVFLFQVL